MRKTITCWARKNWNEDFHKGDGWHKGFTMPELYANKEHIKNLNLKKWYGVKDKSGLFREFRKIKITIED